MRAHHQQQRQPVGRGLGDVIGADHAVGAGAVVHHHRMAPYLGELLCDQSPDDVCAAACRVRHDERHGLGRIALGATLRPCGQRARCGQRSQARKRSAAVHE
ncbi:hypothetical protein SDC9_137949 [bioreactor metagenome]|uniref:Uncharacterized protein n=1 Tax=bioreactor metagenome TaxID=1076179 RepID=A0A645DNG2_9ZZZZ